MFSQRFSAAAIVILAAGMVWIYWDQHVNQRLYDEANAEVRLALAEGDVIVEKAKSMIAIKPSDDLKAIRPTIESLARETSERSHAVADHYRRAAQKVDEMAARAPTEEKRRVWSMRRDSFLELAEAAEASAKSYGVWLDPNVVDIPTGFAAAEPFSIEAEAARAKADELKDAANALERAVRDGQ